MRGLKYYKVYSDSMQRTPDTEEKRAIIDTADLLDKIWKLTEKLSASTEELSKSSKRLEAFTAILIVFTLILGVVAIMEFVKDLVPEYAVAVLGFVFLSALLYFTYFLTKIKH